MVLEKWKYIIKNWLNCYSDGVNICSVKVETLNNLISRIQRNDDQAKPFSNELENFILDKYPDFLFDNGTVTASTDEEICIIASLLLYFICVNSKDVDLKNVMCNKFGMEDQEIITKFNKTLMQSTSVTYKDIKAAILESCGQDTASALSTQAPVAETPPILRSLHSEVRRLQAALDAERFDRNFLQDELTRTNYKLEKILKDKELFKAEIVSLKAKICSCGQEIQSDDSNNSSHTSTIKLLRQLEEAEQRLVDNQALLDDAVHERNIYKAKVDELKLERDKLIIIHQGESVRASTLEEQLLAANKTNDSLKELVNELRQHNQFNQIDGSLLEFDDPNASMRSIGHNLSINSEACSNVVEVQLMEERANIIDLKKEIDLLEDKIRVIRKTASDEISEYQNNLVSKDYLIQHLKHEIDEGLKQQFILKDSFNDETSKLNNQINELEQKVKDYEVLHEEDSCLLKSLSDKERKLKSDIEHMNNEILKLKEGLIKEQNSKLKMKEEYENYVMKLNEKVLNRNNELVEFQNTLMKNSEDIEMLNIELRKEKKISDDLKVKYNNDITKINDEKNELQKQIISLQQQITDELASHGITKQSLTQLECLKNNLADELINTNHNKTKLEKELVHSKTLVDTLHCEVNKLKENNNVNKQNFETQLKEVDFNLKKVIEKYKVEINDLNQSIKKISDENYDLVKNIEERDSEIATQNESLNELKELIETLQNQCHKEKVLTNSFKENLQKETEFKKELQQHIYVLHIEKESLINQNDEILHLNKQLSETCKTFETDITELRDQLDKKISEIKILKEKLSREEELNKELNDVNESSKSLIDIKCKEIECLSQKLHDKEATINVLSKKEEDLKTTIDNYKEKILKENRLTEKLSKEYENNLSELQNCILNKNEEINILNMKLMEEKNSFINKQTVSNEEIVKLMEALNSLQQQFAEKSSALEVTKQSLNEFEIFKNNLMEELAFTNKIKSQLEQELEQNKIILNSLQCNETELKQELQHNINKWSEEKESLVNESVANKNEIIKLSENCAILEFDITELKQQLDIELNEKAIWKTKNNMLEEKISEKERLYQELLTSNEQYQHVIDADTQKHCKEIEGLRDLLKDNEYITTGLYQKEKKLESNMEVMVANYEEKLMERNRIIENLTEELETKVENYEEKFIEKNRIIENLTEELKAKVENYEEKLMERNRIVENLTEELKTKVDNYEEKLMERNKIIENLTEELKEKVENSLVINKTYESKILNLENSLLKNIEEIEVLNNELIKVRELSDDNNAKCNNELIKLNNDNNALQQELILLQQHLKNQLAAFAQAKQSLNEINNLNNTLKVELENANELKTKLNEELLHDKCLLNSVQCEMKQLKEENEIIIKQLTNISKKHNDEIDAKNKLEETIKENNEWLKQSEADYMKSKFDLMKQIKQKDNIIATQKKSMTEQKQLLEKIEKEYHEYKVSINESLIKESEIKNDLQQHFYDLLTEKESLITENDLNKKLNIQLAEKLKKLEIDNTEMKQQLDKEINEKHLNKITKMKELEIVKEKLIEKEQKYNELLNDKCIMNLKNEELCQEIDGLRLQLTDNEPVINKLNKDKEDLNTQLKLTIANYENKLLEINGLTEKILTDLKEETLKLSVIKQDYENKILQLESEKNKLLNEITALKSLEDDYKSQIVLKENLISDFASERLILKNMVTVTEDVMKDQITKVIDENIQHIQKLEEEMRGLKEVIENERQMLKEKDTNIENYLKELNDEKTAKEQLLSKINELQVLSTSLTKEILTKNMEIDRITLLNKEYIQHNQQLEKDLKSLKGIIENKKQSLKEKDGEIDNYLNAINKENTTKQQLLIKIDDLENVNIKLKAEVLNQNREIDSIRLQKKQHIEHNQNLEEELKSLKEKIKNETPVIKEKDAKIEKCLKELNEQNNAKEHLIITIDELENQTTNLQDEVRNKNIELSNIRLQNDEHIQHNQALEKELNSLKEIIDNEKQVMKENAKIENCLKELNDERNTKKHLLNKLKELEHENTNLKEVVLNKSKEIESISLQKDEQLKLLEEKLTKSNEYQKKTEIQFNEETIKLKDTLQTELLKNEKEREVVIKLQNDILELSSKLNKKESEINLIEHNLKNVTDVKNKLEKEQNTNIEKVSTLQNNITDERKEIENLTQNKCELETIINVNKSKIENLEKQLLDVQNEKLTLEKQFNDELHNLRNKCEILEEYKSESEIASQAKLEELKTLDEEKVLLKQAIDIKNNEFLELKDVLTKELSDKDAVIKSLKIENDNIKEIVQRETFGVSSQDRGYGSHHRHSEDNHEPYRHTDATSSFSNISEEKDTIADLEKIILNKNRTITTLQSDLTYMKTLMAESETKLLDITKELDNSNENYQQISNQLKKLAAQKNEEISELRKQIAKMSATENRASKIVKVSAKYQAMILKRIAEIKNVAVLKELKNFNNVPLICDDELRKGLNAGAITMEELENFLETTDRHLRKCSEKQLALQKERDRLAEICKINDSEIVDTKKYLTELALYYKTFASVRDVYSQRLGRIVSLQRTVRREILDCDGRIDDATTAKLERSYSAVLQDLCECAMNMERWVERCVDRTVAPEKINQAFSNERVSLAGGNFQNAGLEVQLQELESSFGRLSKEIYGARSKEGSGASGSASATVMEVRAEYEDKLNRMKTKMKQLYQEQISIFREKQRTELCAAEEREKEAVRKLSATSRAYEEHIRALTAELWHVGEKYLMKNDEAEWLKKNKSGSLMSLQFVNSSGLTAPREEKPRMSDTHSLHSLPVNNNKTRTLHMSDEEGEMFDNRYLKELMSTPRSQRHSPRPSVGPRLSELKWRNSLCPPHLKSSYPAETQFASTVDEEDIKNLTLNPTKQRKEVGITAYKKPGPPTPSKQAGRLSATDSELREYQRQELEVSSKKVGTPSRILGLFRSNRNDDTTGTPRRRLSLFRSNKK